MKRFVLVLLLFPLIASAQQGSNVSLLTFGADPTGTNDVAAAFNNAAAAGASHITVPPGKYLLNGAGTVALNNIEIDCLGSAAGANYGPGGVYGSNGATFLLTSTSVQPFTVANAVRIKNCNFYWPNQTGRSPTPIAYPPLFTEPSGTQLANFELIGDRIIDAYDVLDASNVNDSMGGIQLVDTVGYAIRYWFSVANVQETWTIAGMAADWNLYQNVANAGSQYLVKWTAANGAFIHVFGNGNGSTTTSTVSVGGLVFSGSVFAYNKLVWVDGTGAFNESTLSGIADSVPRVLEVDAGGCFAQVSINMLYWSNQYLGGGVDNAPVFSFGAPASSGCTDTGIDIGGSLIQAQGDVLDVSGPLFKTINLHLGGNGQYAQSSTRGTYYFANINSANSIFTATGNFIQPLAPGSTKRGFNIQRCYQCVISNNTFSGVYNPIAVA